MILSWAKPSYKHQNHSDKGGEKANWTASKLETFVLQRTQSGE